MSDICCTCDTSGKGTPIDLADFAVRRRWTGSQGHELCAYPVQTAADGVWIPEFDSESGKWHAGLEWEEPRDIRRVAVCFADADGIPADIVVQYWRRNWPTPGPERRPGARRGWIGVDDPWHGEWVTVRAARTVSNSCCEFVFDPIDLGEVGRQGGADQLVEAADYLARFRRTLKIRVVAGGEELPRITCMHAYSDARWAEGVIDVRFVAGVEGGSDWSGRADAYNGEIVRVEGLDFGSQDAVTADGGWRCSVTDDGNPKGVRLFVRYAQVGTESCDRTLVTLCTSQRSFTFLVTDLDRGPIYIPDYGVYVTWQGTDISLAEFESKVAEARDAIYDRVTDEPEQSLTRAMKEIPALDVTKQAPFGLYCPLGVEAGRQEFALRYNGELFVDKRFIKISGRDAAKLLYPGHQLRFRFGTGDPADFRERRDGTRQSVLGGWMPIVISQWLDREIEFIETAFAALVDGPMVGPDELTGDEDVVSLIQFKIRNTTHGCKNTRLWIVIAPQERVEIRNEKVVAVGRVVPDVSVGRQWRIDDYESDYLRCTIDTAGRGELLAVGYSGGQSGSVAGFDLAVQVPDNVRASVSEAVPTAVAYDLTLEGGESHTITLAVPFVTYVDPAEWERVAALDFDAKLDDVVSYWEAYVGSGGLMELPDTLLTDFHKASRGHIAIAVDKEPANGLFSVPAATWAYGVCANEACWQITMLDQAGHHDRAEAYLENFIQTQGTTPLDGLFQSAEGVMQGNDLDNGAPRRSGFSYNLDPGFIMECLADHYRLTGDKVWLDRVTPNLLAACEFVIRERTATKVVGPEGEKDRAWGLLPVGHLEDNPEWRHWFAVNAHAYGGMHDIASILAATNHPEADRLLAEAEAFRQDIRTAVYRAMVESPVVQLLDGTYVPHVPTRTGIRGRELGWFREVAYGAIQLLEGDVYDPCEEEMTWVLKDSEDNLFVTREWGRPVDLEKFWFSHGGVTIQANLTDLGIDYLRRGQIEHGLRALFNNFGASLYPDVRVFTEHPVVELGHGVGPFYKTSDEAKALVWLRAFLLWEEDNALHLAKGAPRSWFAPGQSFGLRGMASHFGPVTYRIESSEEEVTAQIELDADRKPGVLVLHVRQPAGGGVIRAVEVNGKLPADFDASTETVRISDPDSNLVVQILF